MPLELTALHPLFAARVDGVDLSQPVDAALADQIHQAMNQYAVLIFRDQQINDDQHMAFGQALGPLEPSRATVDLENHRLSHERMADISNLGKDGQLMPPGSLRRLFNLGNRLWHTDSSFKPTPALYSLLYAVDVPTQGGETQFADMRAAWDALDPATQDRLHGLTAMHSLLYSRAQLGFHDFDEQEREKFKPVPQRMVRRHPGSGRLSIYVASHIGAIQGWADPEAIIFTRELIEFATQPQFVFEHHWRNGDLVIWDNRCTLHRARPYDDQNLARDLRRVTLTDSAPTLAQPV